MKFKVDPMKVEPIFLQLVSQVKMQMAKGRLRTGDKLPTVREMAADLLVNPNTVQKAYQELIREGLIFSRKGMGNFIGDFGDERQRLLRKGGIENLLDNLYAEACLAGLSIEDLEKRLRIRFEEKGEKDHE